MFVQVVAAPFHSKCLQKEGCGGVGGGDGQLWHLSLCECPGHVPRRRGRVPSCRLPGGVTAAQQSWGRACWAVGGVQNPFAHLGKIT